MPCPIALEPGSLPQLGEGVDVQKGQKNMATTLEADLCIIGGGSGGLALAAGAAQMGARTVLVEAGKMGGDCLNYGCVPSKAMIAAGHASHAMRHADQFGIKSHEPEIDFKGVHDHVHSVIGAIAPHDSVERFEGLGVTVLQERARFLSATEIEAGDTKVQARRFAIATGSSPVVPPIPGLADVPHDTNETIFDNQVAPSHLIVIGGGPIGSELAQFPSDVLLLLTASQATVTTGNHTCDATCVHVSFVCRFSSRSRHFYSLLLGTAQVKPIGLCKCCSNYTL